MCFQCLVLCLLISRSWRVRMSFCCDGSFIRWCVCLGGGFDFQDVLSASLFFSHDRANISGHHHSSGDCRWHTRNFVFRLKSFNVGCSGNVEARVWRRAHRCAPRRVELRNAKHTSSGTKLVRRIRKQRHLLPRKRHVVSSGSVPDCDVAAVFGPNAKRLRRKLAFSGLVIAEDGSFQRIEIRGPPSFPTVDGKLLYFQGCGQNAGDRLSFGSGLVLRLYAAPRNDVGACALAPTPPV